MGEYCEVFLCWDFLFSVWVRFYSISSSIIENGSEVSIIVDLSVFMLLVSSSLVVIRLVIIF